MADLVKENSTAYLTASFKDKDKNLEAPASISYRVDDNLSGNEIRGDTPVTPAAAEVEIVLKPVDTAIVDNTKAKETRVVTVTGTYGVDDQVQDKFVFEVENLRFV